MEHLWSKRFQEFIHNRIFLLRRLANGFAFLPVLIFLFGLYYYPQLIEALPKNFPVMLVLAIVIAWTITRGSLRSFVQMADIVYLIPKEKGMATYFRKCMVYNIILQCFFVLATLVLLSPLYFARVSTTVNDFIVFISIMFILKIWNIFILWQALKMDTSSLIVIRWSINFVLINGFLLKNVPIIIVMLIVIGIYHWGTQKFQTTNRIDWQRLIELEQRLDARFYNWTGSFVDHPHVVSKIKRRKYVTKVAARMRKNRTYAYHYLYVNMFTRTDGFGIIVRIAAIGMLLLWFLPNVYFLISVYIAILFMIGLQIHSFWHHFTYQFWTNMHPITDDDRNQAYLSSSFYVLLATALILLIPVFVKHFTPSVLSIFICLAIVFPYSFIYLYIKKKIRVLTK